MVLKVIFYRNTTPFSLPSALPSALLVGWQEGNAACKKVLARDSSTLGQGGHGPPDSLVAPPVQKLAGKM